MNEMGLTLGDHWLGGYRQMTWNKIPQKAPACFGTYTGFNLLKELYGQGHDPDPPYFPAKDRIN